MASYGSTPLFHIVGLTPEAPTLASVGGETLTAAEISAGDISDYSARYVTDDGEVDVVVFAAPQLSLVEVQTVADLCDAHDGAVAKPLIVCTSPAVYGDALRLGLVERIERKGGKVLQGTCFYNQYAREIGEANGWTRLLSNSAKIVNILGGYGYRPALASMEACVEAAFSGKVAM